MSIDAALIGTRFVHYVFLTALFGGLLFPLYTGPLAHSEERTFRRAALAAIALGVLSGLAWFAVTTASMADVPVLELDSEMIQSTLVDTAFGRLWIVRLSLLVVLFLSLVVMPLSLEGTTFPVMAAGGALASLAATGHGTLGYGLQRLAHILADAAHLLAAGVWLGAFPPLIYALQRGQDLPGAAVKLARFSMAGYLAVATLLFSGAVNTSLLIDLKQISLTDPYTGLLALKILMFFLMLCVAASNKFWFVPVFHARLTSGGPAQKAVDRLRYQIIGEQILGLAVLAIVSAVGTMSLPQSTS